MADWRTRLKEIITGGKPPSKEADLGETRRHIREFIDTRVMPAFEELKQELEGHGRTVTIDRQADQATLTVYRDGDEEFSYAIRGHAYHKMSFAWPEFPAPGEEEPWFYKAEVRLGHYHYANRRMSEFTKEDIIEDFLNDYARWMHWSEAVSDESES